MKIYDIDTGNLEARRGATVIEMVTVEDICKAIEITRAKLWNNSINEDKDCNCDVLADIELTKLIHTIQLHEINE